MEEIAEHCLRFTPQICLRGSDAIFLEIGRCYRLYSEDTFLRRATALLGKLHLPVAIGLADSLEWALVRAKFRDPLPLEALFELADPLGHDARAPELVAKLVGALRLLGIRRLEEFRSIPRRELASRFGPVGLLCRQRLEGELPMPWKPWFPPEVVSESAEYLYSDFEAALEPLLFEAKKLLDRIHARLRSRGLKAAALELRIRCEKLSISPERERRLKIEFLLPQSDAKGTLAILREFLAKEFSRRPLLTPLEKFTITVTQTVPGFEAQRNLYHNREERQEAYAALISQLTQAHGSGSVFQAEAVEERLPEGSWRKVARAGKGAELAGRIPLRPTHLLKPRRIEVAGDYVYIRKKPYRIGSWAEYTERISARWLHGTVERTYFQVEVEGGPLLWIFLDPENNYYLHGYYG
jgi:protein ImuB